MKELVLVWRQAWYFPMQLLKLIHLVPVRIIFQARCITVKYNSATIGIEENKIEECFPVYPNPANSEIIIQPKEFKENYTLNISDISGRIILFKNISSSNKTIIETNEFADGIYFISAKTESGKLFCSKKIIVQHKN